MRKLPSALSSKMILIALCLATLAGAQSKSTATFEVQASKSLMVSMRDGVRLATDVYRPAQNGTPVPGRFPTLLIRTPYTRFYQESGDAAFFVPRGYVLVVQSIRGRYGSEGKWRLFRDDPADGYDTSAWIAS